MLVPFPWLFSLQRNCQNLVFSQAAPTVEVTQGPLKTQGEIIVGLARYHICARCANIHQERLIQLFSSSNYSFYPS